MITLVFAHAQNGVIGRDGALPWHLPADLKRFKALTLGKPMIMGRKTFESLPGLLPSRRHIVLTRDAGWRAAGAEVAHSVDAALALAGDGDVSVIGGAEVFSLFRDRANRAELTVIWQDYDGDAHFPPRSGGRLRGGRTRVSCSGRHHPGLHVLHAGTLGGLTARTAPGITAP